MTDTKLPKLLEKQIQKEILVFLSYLTNLKAYRIANGPLIFGAGPNKHFAKNPTPGIPDIVVLLNGGQVIWAEVKTTTGRQSPDQKNFQQTCEKLGHQYVIWRSLDDSMDTLRKRGFLP